MKQSTVNILSFLVILNWAILSGRAEAYEVDSYTGRSGTSLKDSSRAINDEIEKRIQWAIEKANRELEQENKVCQDQSFYKNDGNYNIRFPAGLYRSLHHFTATSTLRPVKLGGWSAMDEWAEQSSDIDKIFPDYSNSIYKDVGFIKGSTVSLGFIRTLNSVIKVDDHFIGADKLGHFFELGFAIFEMSYNNAPLLHDSIFTQSMEHRTYGLQSSGVYSYGDLAANVAGYEFFKDLYFGKDPIVKCVNGRYEKARKFEIRDYVTDAWDEAQNCSIYWNPKESTPDEPPPVQLSVEAGMQRAGVHQCPMNVNRCVAAVEALRSKYGYRDSIMELILHPDCRNARHQNEIKPDAVDCSPSGNLEKLQIEAEAARELSRKIAVGLGDE